jgi:hypothetical protein
MTKRSYVGLALLGLCALVALWLVARAPSRLLCEGKPLRQWILESSSGANSGAPLIALGPRAVPELVALFQTRDSLLQRRVWPLLKNLPPRPRRIMQKIVPAPGAARVRAAAAQWLGRLGPEASPAVPTLARAIYDQDMIVSRSALTALGRIGKVSLPCLIEALRSTNMLILEGATFGLASLGPDAEEAVPILTQNLQNPRAPIRAATASCLNMIGPPAQPALPALTQLVTDSVPAVRFSAQAAIARIGGTTSGPAHAFGP